MNFNADHLHGAGGLAGAAGSSSWVLLSSVSSLSSCLVLWAALGWLKCCLLFSLHSGVSVKLSHVCQLRVRGLRSGHVGHGGDEAVGTGVQNVPWCSGWVLGIPTVAKVSAWVSGADAFCAPERRWAAEIVEAWVLSNWIAVPLGLMAATVKVRKIPLEVTMKTSAGPCVSKGLPVASLAWTASHPCPCRRSPARCPSSGWCMSGTCWALVGRRCTGR